MSVKVKYAFLIDRYIEGEMTKEEKKSFEHQLEENTDLLEEYLLEVDIRQMLAQEDVLRFREKLNAVIHEENEKSLPGRLWILNRKQLQLVAASIAILIAVTAGIVFLLNPGNQGEKLFNKYYSSDKPLHITRSSNDIITDALRFYQQKNYPAAIDQFNIILEQDPENAAIRFYTAIAYIETEDVDKAVNYLITIIKHDNNLYIEPANWYLGLCYLKKGEKELAIKQFEPIAVDSKNYYHDDAVSILKKLK